MPRGRGRKFKRDNAAGTSTNWTNTGFKRPPPPPGLAGKEIGLYYRSLKRGGVAKTRVVSLRVPRPVIMKLINNLDKITAIAKKENIKIHPKSISVLFNKKCSTDTEVNKKIVEEIVTVEPSKKLMKTHDNAHARTSQSLDFIPFNLEDEEIEEEIDSIEPNNSITSSSLDFIPIKSEDTPHASTSSSLEFIPIKSETDSSYGDGSRVLSLRGAGDYKYSYEDIITGSFTEKLEESLSKGINIMKHNDDIDSLNVAYYEDFKDMTTKSQYKRMLKFRETLPTYKKRDALLKVINENQVVVISGETGCGKSTQVPQLILDEAILKKKGANIKILITQPRRIAASSLASRVASERAEPMGNSVGFAVRLEKIDARPRASMMFCTTGILLVDLEINQGLTDYSHVILDEVHERDCHIDLAMCMLKQVLQKRIDLKLILMSATLDAEKLTTYFDNCPLMHIEGLAYPVKDIYLEDILDMTGFQLPPQMQMQATKPHHRFIRKFRVAAAEEEKRRQYRAEIEPWLRSIRYKLQRLHPSVYETLLDHRIEYLNIDLVFAVLRHVCREPPGAILVFLPGIGDITKLLSKISDNESLLGSQIKVYALHSKLPSLDQNKIFDRPPDHIRKIVVATNIAETSITIDDIVYVIDCGKVKYSGLNVEDYISTLKTEFASQANLRQRRGRAGRCQPGVCYHLLTSYRASMLDKRLLPELQRSNLLEPVLTIKRLRLGRVADAFRNVPDPPANTTIESAIKHLQQCGALDDNELLTPLGWHLARLPLHPTAGKLVLLGALFGCLDRAVSVAAVWSFKDPFILALDKEVEMKAVKRKLSLGEPSDHVAISEAIIQWERSDSKREFAYKHFLSSSTLELLRDMKNQIGNNLSQMGFLSSGNVTSSWENRNTHNLSLFKALVAASLYPNIAAAKWTNINTRNPNKQVRVKVRIPEGNANIHPSSMMIPPKFSKTAVKLCSNPGANWLVYWLKQKSSELFLIEVTLVYTLPLLFFGELKVSEIEDDATSCHVSVTSYNVKMYKETAELLLELRNLLDQVLASKIMISSNHSIKHSQFEEQVLNAVIEVITAEDERIEYLDTESDNSECD